MGWRGWGGQLGAPGAEEAMAADRPHLGLGFAGEECAWRGDRQGAGSREGWGQTEG